MRRLLLCLGLASACAPEEEPAPPAVIQTVAGVFGTAGFNGSGLPALESWLYDPEDVEVRADGVVFIADDNNHAIRRMWPDGTLELVAGGVFIGDGPDGPALLSSFNHPASIAVDPSDPELLWIAATGNNRIKRLDLAALEVEVAAGTGESAFYGDGGDAYAAAMGRPTSVAFGPDGAMYVSDKLNHVVRRIDQDGVITTVVGTPEVRGYRGDGGPAIEARLRAQRHAKYDPSSRITIAGEVMYVVDTGNQVVRTVDLATGIIETRVGAGEAGADPDGTPPLQAHLNQPHDVAVGPDGTLFIADSGSHCVRALLPSDELITVAGVCGEAGFDGDGGSPLGALLYYPSGIGVGPDGTLFIADTFNHVVRRVDHPLSR